MSTRSLTERGQTPRDPLQVGSHESNMLSLLRTALTSRVVMEKIISADQDQVDKYEADSKSNITDDNTPTDDEYFLSSEKKSISI